MANFTSFWNITTQLGTLEEIDIYSLGGVQMQGQLNMLNFVCTDKARPRIVTINRGDWKEEDLEFTLNLTFIGHSFVFKIFDELICICEFFAQNSNCVITPFNLFLVFNLFLFKMILKFSITFSSLSQQSLKVCKGKF